MAGVVIFKANFSQLLLVVGEQLQRAVLLIEAHLVQSSIEFFVALFFSLQHFGLFDLSLLAGVAKAERIRRVVLIYGVYLLVVLGYQKIVQSHGLRRLLRGFLVTGIKFIII